MMSGPRWIMSNRDRGTFIPSDQAPECSPVGRDDSGRDDQVGAEDARKRRAEERK
jgi:hypothetical protein